MVGSLVVFHSCSRHKFWHKIDIVFLFVDGLIFTNKFLHIGQHLYQGLLVILNRHPIGTFVIVLIADHLALALKFRLGAHIVVNLLDFVCAVVAIPGYHSRPYKVINQLMSAAVKIKEILVEEFPLKNP